mmetsp:Transcript_26817/g.78078  ORF Transcript_26817/g.78078 Transcript_26817/m.78078 type:complete len:202 (-) Transcript_26817:85-690(-)
MQAAGLAGWRRAARLPGGAQGDVKHERRDGAQVDDHLPLEQRPRRRRNQPPLPPLPRGCLALRRVGEGGQAEQRRDEAVQLEHERLLHHQGERRQLELQLLEVVHAAHAVEAQEELHHRLARLARPRAPPLGGPAGGGGRREHDGQRGVQQLVVELQVPRAERELEHRLQRVCEVAPKVAAEPVHAQLQQLCGRRVDERDV